MLTEEDLEPQPWMRKDAAPGTVAFFSAALCGSRFWGWSKSGFKEPKGKPHFFVFFFLRGVRRVNKGKAFLSLLSVFFVRLA